MDPDLALLAAAAALLMANAFFSAAESALLALRRGRADPLSPSEDSAHPGRASRRDAEELALAAQLGRSTASLGLGYVVALFLTRSYPLAGVIVGAGIAIIAHGLIGNQFPRIAASRRAERFARLTLPSLRLFSFIIRPLTWPMSWLLLRGLRILGIRWTGLHPLAYTAAEIRMLVARSSEEGVMEDDEREMIHGVFEISHTVAREVMSPRTEVVAVSAGISLTKLLEVVVAEEHSRLPVYDGTIDNVVGVLLTKDLLPLLARPEAERGADFDLRAIMRPPYFVPDSKPVDDLLAELRRQSVHLAIVVDEFGGTYGVVTLEDLLEEIVGEIHDEYDVVEPEFTRTPEGDILMDGAVSLSEVNERFGTMLPQAAFDTIGGFIFGSLERIPRVGDVVAIPFGEGDCELRVEAVEDRRVSLVRLTGRQAADSLP